VLLLSHPIDSIDSTIIIVVARDTGIQTPLKQNHRNQWYSHCNHHRLRSSMYILHQMPKHNHHQHIQPHCDSIQVRMRHRSYNSHLCKHLHCHTAVNTQQPSTQSISSATISQHFTFLGIVLSPFHAQSVK